jgi:hypothetical protein
VVGRKECVGYMGKLGEIWPVRAMEGECRTSNKPVEVRSKNGRWTDVSGELENLFKGQVWGHTALVQNPLGFVLFVIPPPPPPCAWLTRSPTSPYNYDSFSPLQQLY